MIIRMKMQNRYVSHHERNSIIMNIIQYLTYINIMFFYDFFFAVSRIQDSLRFGESPCPVLTYPSWCFLDGYYLK